MQKEDAIELVQGLKDIRDEIVGLLDQANDIVKIYYGQANLCISRAREIDLWEKGYDVGYLNSDIRNIEKREGLGQ